MNRPIILWILAILITLSSVIYQRLTGPTRPIRDSVEIAGEEIKYSLLRSHDTSGEAELIIKAPSHNITGTLQYRRYKSFDEWLTVPLERSGDQLISYIPVQPPAGKVMYQVNLNDETGAVYHLTEEPVIIRFTGVVPVYVLIPHIIFMFGAMLLSTRTGLEVIKRRQAEFKLALWTIGLMFIGGLIMGPIVQKLAFGEFWTGWPFGHDLTDNKTVVAWLIWVLALWRGSKSSRGHWYYIIAAIMTIVIFIIPHSVLGSELDYTKMPQVD